MIGGIIIFMTRYRNIPPKSFKNSSWLPGTTGNPFDVILNSGEQLDRIPSFLFVIILTTLACLGGKFNLLYALILFSFFLCDWFLIALLPRVNRSYGPVKPVVFILAVLRTFFALLPFWWSLGLQITGILLVIYGFYIEPFRLDIHAETLRTNKLHSGQHLRLVHLGDLHIERLTQREEQILKALEELKPDLILFSGDILNLSYINDPLAQDEAHKFLSALHAPLEVYGVTGSPPVDPPDVYSKMIANTDLHRLDNRCITLPIRESSLCISGVTCTHQPENDFVPFKNLKSDVPMDTEKNANRLHILLYHTPDMAPLVCHSGVDLQLSGHTHGGQVRLPFIGALYTASLYKKAFESGRYAIGEMTLYVTRGLGMEGGIAPRVRFLCRPELIVWGIAGNK